MPQASNITINDGQATPVTRTFTVVGPQDGDKPASYREIASRTIREQQFNLSLAVTRAAGNATRDKVKARVFVPVLRTDTAGVTRAVDVASATLEFTIPTLCDASERANLLAFAKNFAAHTSVASGVLDLLPQY